VSRDLFDYAVDGCSIVDYLKPGVLLIHFWPKVSLLSSSSAAGKPNPTGGGVVN
jgi:hypothetical protein